MLNIKFGNEAVNLHGLIEFAIKNSLDVFQVLKTAHMQRALVSDEVNLLSRFINFLSRNHHKAKGQLFQDAFAACVVANRHPNTFLEFGATNGVELSNSYMLEFDFGWKGVLAEPSPQWHEALKRNRPNSAIITDCIWKESGQELDFFVSDHGVLSTIEEFRQSDKSSMPRNTQVRNESGRTVAVTTITLNDLIEMKFADSPPSYISVDTEGSEFEILNAFDFDRYGPVVFTVEHNHTKLEKGIDALMAENSYARVFRNITRFDAWYVRSDVLEKLS